MSLYRKLYVHLFNAITDALRRIDANEPEKASQILKKAQQWCEEEYLNAAEEETREKNAD